ncbi:hypothetical protein BDV06DRAFT_218641 [Aspergillus oleicola]
MPQHTRASLKTATTTLLDAFSSGSSILTLQSTFTTTPPPTIHEHGLKELAPFLGRPFTGQNELKSYFEILNEHLGIEDASFDDENEWAVDTENMVVCLRGRARFVSKRTGEGWDEVFAYRVEVADETGEGVEGRGKLKVRKYEVWADTGAAYLAMRGKLKGLTG